MTFKMKQVFLSGAALMMALPAAALADNLPARPNDSAAQTSPGSSGATGVNMRQQLTADLQHAGFTDVRIVPDSFLVQAKDKSGNPVTMFINPTSMTMVTKELSQPSTAATATTATSGSDSMFTNVAPGEMLSSKVVGMSIYNNNNQDIGKIKDIAFDNNGIRAYIVSVGGFLGMGDHYVAVSPSAVNITGDGNARHAEMNTDAAQLKSAPEYQYSSAK